MCVSVNVHMQMCSIVVLNLRMSALGIRNPNFKTKKEDPTSILQYTCTSNRFASRTSFGLCPVFFAVQFTLTLAKQSKAKQNVCSLCPLLSGPTTGAQRCLLPRCRPHPPCKDPILCFITPQVRRSIKSLSLVSDVSIWEGGWWWGGEDGRQSKWKWFG